MEHVPPEMGIVSADMPHPLASCSFWAICVSVEVGNNNNLYIALAYSGALYNIEATCTITIGQ